MCFFDPIVEKSFPEDHPLDVIGFVADVGVLKTILTQDTQKLNVLIQDLKMQRIYSSLWDQYADDIFGQYADEAFRNL
ncbi:hypothetical protein L1987_36450 [Smallanthus sonchifolius]|uniref:Uncharacterized protein n=1 Tax=Smallanthus sonchifolius TaxID=185202 RepID=A0ACB9HG17_9ASTR|nr:hypothetical protein L1987_36450 [Smallanthus sonchifolius]